MASRIPLKTTSWRISPRAYRELLDEADAQLVSIRESYRDRELSGYRRRLDDAKAVGIGAEQAESALLEGEERVTRQFEPRWHLVTKRERLDTPAGSIEDVVPTIEVPGRYTFASVTLRGGSHSIDITLGPAGPSITLAGTDGPWLRQAERWANEVLRNHRPWWWWLLTAGGGVLTASVGVAAYFILANLLPFAGVPEAAAGLAGLAVDWGILLTVMTLVWRFRATITEPGPKRAAAFLAQAGLLVAGAVMGVIISRLADSLLPA